MEAVRGINIPMYTTLRRTSVAFTMIMEYFLSGKKHSSFVLGRYGILIVLVSDCYTRIIHDNDNESDYVFLSTWHNIPVLCHVNKKTSHTTTLRSKNLNEA